MASRYVNFFNSTFAALAMFAIIAGGSDLSLAQNVGGNNNGLGGNGFGAVQVGVVGGVAVDAESVLNRAHQRIDGGTKAAIMKSLGGVDSDIDRVSKLRMVSLKLLNQEIKNSISANKPVPVEVQFMAGLQRIEFLIVDSENNDLIIAGPGEGLTTDVFGNVVGAKSNTPAIHLEDFLTAMRTADNARQGTGISVSMDPTAEGMQNYRVASQRIRNQGGFQADPRQAANLMQDAMGEHNITLTGVPQNSRYAQVLVAADHHMKRLANGLEKSNANNFPSILAMAEKAGARRLSGAPRMWMECNYEPVAKDENGMVWELRGQGIKALTENSFFDKDGNVHRDQGKRNVFAEKWANNLTERFEEVSQAEPVFRDLRNLMDMSVVAAIISKNRMLEKMNLNLDAISSDSVQAPNRPVPTTVPTEVSFVNILGSYVVTASGGVQVDSWAIAANTKVDAALEKTSQLAINSKGGSWWWNAN